jgi:cytoskeletal protein RodZ
MNEKGGIMLTPIGSILRQERLRQNIQLEQIEQDTKIRKAYLLALETDDHAHLPPKVYATGFMKQYCAYLGFSADTQAELLAAFKAAAFPEQVAPMESELRMQSQKDDYTKKTVNPWVAVIVVVCLVLGTLTGKYLLTGRLGGESPKTTEQQPSPSQKEPVEELPPAQEPVVFTEISMEVRIKPQQRCWMAITVDGTKLVYEGTMEAGDSQTFTGKKSVHIWAGQAGAVELTVNGVEIVDLGEGIVRKEFLLSEYTGG